MARDSQQNYSSIPVGFVAFLFAAAVCFVAWFANHRGLTQVWLWFEWLMLQPIAWTIGLFSDYSRVLSSEIVNANTIKMACPEILKDPNAYRTGTRIECQGWKPNFLTGWWVSTEVGKYWRWVLVLIAGYSIYRVFTRPLRKFSGPLDVTSFLNNQSKHWKAIVPFLHKDFVTEDAPEYAPSRDAESLARDEKVVMEGVFIEAEAKRVLRSQLGPVFKKANFGAVEKALFVCFGLRVLRKPKESKKLFDSINESMRGGKPANLALASARFDEIFEKNEIKKVVDGHNFVSTALFELLVRACDYDGTLPPAEFLAWTKPSNRSLWYALNRAPADDRLEIASFSEGLQIITQWQAESVCKQNDRYMTNIFYDRSLVAWKSTLYSMGVIDEEVKNLNSVEMEKLRREEIAKNNRAKSRVAPIE